MSYIVFKFEDLIEKEDVEIHKCKIFMMHMNTFVNWGKQWYSLGFGSWDETSL